MGCRHSSVDLSVPTILSPRGSSPKHTFINLLTNLSHFCLVKRTKKTKRGLVWQLNHVKAVYFYWTRTQVEIKASTPITVIYYLLSVGFTTTSMDRYSKPQRRVSRSTFNLDLPTWKRLNFVIVEDDVDDESLATAVWPDG